MLKYGTKFTETEILLALMNDDRPYAENLMSSMTIAESMEFSLAVRQLAEVAVYTSQARTERVPKPFGYCRECSTDLYVEWERCPNCGTEQPLKK